MKISRRARNLAIGLGSSAVLMVGFQNCSKTPLEQVEEAQKIDAMPMIDLKSRICSEARFSAGESGKFVFIMDLSASNFGAWTKKPVGGVNFWYWDPSQATDAAGDRFEAVKYFLNNCGNQPGNQFAFIGFSRAAGTLSSGGFSCDHPAFVSSSQVQSQIDAFKARQAADENWYKKWVFPNYLTEPQPDSLIYSVTSYTSASKCLEKLIVDDLTDGANQTDRYNVFFISDGVPEDKAGTGCNTPGLSDADKTTCHMNATLSAVTMTRTAALSKGKDLRIQGIYYGDTGGVVPVVLNALSKEGGTSQVVSLAGFSQNQTALCDLVVTQNALDFQPDLYAAINLTVRREQGRFVADSDMDGLSDEAEERCGTDPQDPRSSGVPGVLDGICERLGGLEACHDRRSRVTCSPSQFDALGLTDCDIKMLGLDQLPGVLTPGTDSDRDGMPDFVEIVKGLDPGRADMTDDPDGDGLTNREEILRGSEPFFFDNGLIDVLLNRHALKFEPKSRIPACAQGEWNLTVTQLQTARTRTLPERAGDFADLRHKKDEQIVLILYRLLATNSQDPEIEYYGRHVRVTASGTVGDETLTATPSDLVPADFKPLGKTRP